MSESFIKFVKLLNKIKEEGRFYRIKYCLTINDNILLYNNNRSYGDYGRGYALTDNERDEERKLVQYYSTAEEKEKIIMNEFLENAATTMAGNDLVENLGGTNMEEQNMINNGAMTLLDLMEEQEYGSFIEGPELREKFAGHKVAIIDVIAMNKRGSKATDGDEAKYILLELDIKDENGLNRVMIAPGYTKKGFMRIASNRFVKDGLVSGDKKFRDWIKTQNLEIKVKDSECIPSIDGKHQDAVLDFYQSGIRIDFNRIK